jgi:hypothetical protein
MNYFGAEFEEQDRGRRHERPEAKYIQQAQDEKHGVHWREDGVMHT